MDGSGEATPVAMLSLFEETAFSHCEAADWGIYRLLGEGYGWVLLRGAMEMRRYPAYRERFHIESWLSSSRLFRGEREFRVLAEDGEVLGAARSLWAFMSIERMRPAPVFPEILEAWAPNGVKAADLPLEGVDFPEPPSAPNGALREKSFHVRASEIDTNGHVNNVNYLAWALEALAAEAGEDRMLARVRGHYKREVTYGSQVTSLALPEGEGFRHGVYAEGAAGEAPYLAAAAVSEWKARPAKAASRALFAGACLARRRAGAALQAAAPQGASLQGAARQGAARQGAAALT